MLTSCARHAPPEDIIRMLCEADIRKTIMTAKPKSGSVGSVEGPVEGSVEVNIIEITRKGIGESKNTRDIPDKTLVYPIACLLQKTVDGLESEPETLFLYFYRNSDGDWSVRGRK